MHEDYYKYTIEFNDGYEPNLDEVSNTSATKEYENIKIPDNQTGFESRQSYKIDTSKKMNELRNSARVSTKIKINNEIIELENTEYGHDVSHIVAQQFCKYYPEAIEMLCNKFPTVFPNKESFYSFQPSGELIPEIIDTIFKEGKISENYILSISEDKLNSNSQYWKNKIIRERQSDIRQIRKSTNRDIVHLEPMKDKESAINQLLNVYIPLESEQEKLLLNEGESNLDKASSILFTKILKDIESGQPIVKYSQIFVDFNRGKFNEQLSADYLFDLEFVLNEDFGTLVERSINDINDSKTTPP